MAVYQVGHFAKAKVRRSFFRSSKVFMWWAPDGGAVIVEGRSGFVRVLCVCALCVCFVCALCVCVLCVCVCFVCVLCVCVCVALVWCVVVVDLVVPTVRGVVPRRLVIVLPRYRRHVIRSPHGDRARAVYRLV